jgi:hypothetical protein
MPVQTTDSDTITVAALLKALQMALASAEFSRSELDALETHTVRAIKSLDTDEFAYGDQAQGLTEALQLVRGMFRVVRHELDTTVR